MHEYFWQQYFVANFIDDETIQNLIKEQTPMWKGKGRNKM
jgi:hypothetical protein